MPGMGADATRGRTKASQVPFTSRAGPHVPSSESLERSAVRSGDGPTVTGLHREPVNGRVPWLESRGSDRRIRGLTRRPKHQKPFTHGVTRNTHSVPVPGIYLHVDLRHTDFIARNAASRGLRRQHRDRRHRPHSADGTPHGVTSHRSWNGDIFRFLTNSRDTASYAPSPS